MRRISKRGLGLAELTWQAFAIWICLTSGVLSFSSEQLSIVARHVIQQRGNLCLCGLTREEAETTLNASSLSDHPSSGRNVEYVDFWGAKIRNSGEEEVSDSKTLPALHTLDPWDGPLPPGSYLQDETSDVDPKPVCRIALAVDWTQKAKKFVTGPMEEDEVIRQIQVCIESGFQSFQLHPSQNKQSDLEMIRHLLQETPKHVEMHWTVRFSLPSQITPRSVREAFSDLLTRTGADSVDTLLVPYDPKILPEYHLEVLDVLRDLRREGFIRSIGVEKWPQKVMELAEKNRFQIDVHQQPFNLLLPPVKLSEADSLGPTQWWTNPLAGQFLSDEFIEYKVPPTHISGWDTVKVWYEKKYEGDKKKEDKANDLAVWNKFREVVLDPLRYISSKHEVSIADVALRWALQHDERKTSNSVTSVVVPLQLVEEPADQLRKKIRELRDIFRFELDEEDLSILSKAGIRPKPRPKTLRIDEIDVPIDEIPEAFLAELEDKMVKFDLESTEDQDGYPEIDFDNPTLWL